MPLPADALTEIDTQVRSGFESRDRIIEIFTDEMYAPGDLDPLEIENAVDAAMAAHERSKADWPDVTDWDRLDHAFCQLSAEGILCLHNAGNTQSDGYGDFVELFHGHEDRESIRGYCFYHGQDTERAVKGGGICLAFGPADAREERTAGPAIGSLVVKVLMEQGLAAEWDGTFGKRIFIQDFDWKKR